MTYKPGDWLIDQEGVMWEYVCRRRKRPGYVTLRLLGHREHLSPRGHRPQVDVEESMLEFLQKVEVQ